VIANVPGYHFQPSARKYVTWAPDGEALVASQRLEGAFGLRLQRFPLSGGASQPVTEGPDTAIDVSPAFSPDGRWLAYLRWENGANIRALGNSTTGHKPEAAGHKSGSYNYICLETRQPNHCVWRWRDQYR
jgi:Tol biopolymer transport system component